jgi:hypothetical protein
VDWIEIYVDSPGKGDRSIYIDHIRLVTVTGADTVAPEAPTALAAATGTDPPLSGGSRPWVELSWSEPTTDVGSGPATGVWRYEVLRAPQGQVPTAVLNPHHVVTDPVFRDLEVQSGETWAYRVRALDFAGNTGPPSSTIEVTVSDALFEDDFESADTSAWARTVP